MFAALALCGVLLACPTIRTAPEPVSVQATGTWVHADSGTSFPEQVAGYRRVRITRFGPGDGNVGVGYSQEDASALVVFTVFVVPAEDAWSFAEVFAGEVRHVVDAHPGTQHEGEVDRTYAIGAERVPGRSAAFRYAEDFAGARRQVRSQLHLFQMRGWQVKYRITYPQIQERAAEVAVQRMLAEAPWGRLAD